MSEIYAKNPDIIFRTIADEFILVPVRHRAVDLKSVFTLNRPAAFIWELIDGTRSLAEITERMVGEFSVEAGQAGADLRDIIAQLEGLSLIQKR